MDTFFLFFCSMCVFQLEQMPRKPSCQYMCVYPLKRLVVLWFTFYFHIVADIAVVVIVVVVVVVYVKTLFKCNILSHSFLILIVIVTVVLDSLIFYCLFKGLQFRNMIELKKNKKKKYNNKPKCKLLRLRKDIQYEM